VKCKQLKNIICIPASTPMGALAQRYIRSSLVRPKKYTSEHTDDLDHDSLFTVDWSITIFNIYCLYGTSPWCDCAVTVSSSEPVTYVNHCQKSCAFTDFKNENALTKFITATSMIKCQTKLLPKDCRFKQCVSLARLLATAP
jgi:hypothetical protein